MLVNCNDIWVYEERRETERRKREREGERERERDRKRERERERENVLHSLAWGGWWEIDIYAYR